MDVVVGRHLRDVVQGCAVGPPWTLELFEQHVQLDPVPHVDGELAMLARFDVLWMGNVCQQNERPIDVIRVGEKVKENVMR